MRVDYTIIFVSDMSRSTAFYRDTIGLPLRFESTHWTEFATDGATLALHVSEPAATPDPPADHPPAGRCRPGLCVSDLDEFHRKMLEKGVPCLQGPAETFGVRIAQYEDPDGLGLSVSEARK